MRPVQLLLLLALLLPASLAMGQTTGKIAGRVTDATNGEALPGVNVVIEGTTTGAITDLDGYYTILNVQPGNHNIRASFVGYTPQLLQRVSVSIDLTTTLNIQMQEETVGLDELVITAQAPVIQRDIAGTQRNISVEEIQAGRYQSITNVIAAQVGVSSASVFNDRPSVRGGSYEETQFIVDGVAQGDPLSNRAHMKVNLDAVQEIKMQTGGFSAEYGNLRSASVNVVTKEGGERYSGSLNYQYSAPALRHDGPMTFGVGSPIYDPMTDPLAGAFDGIVKNADGTPKLDAAGKQIKNAFFAGWDAASKDKGLAKEHLGKPMELYAKWLWQHRSQDSIDKLKELEQQGVVQFAEGLDPDKSDFMTYGDRPDYRASFTFGGPVPFFSRVKFFTSYDTEDTEYSGAYPIPSYHDASWRGKLTTNLTKSMKMNVHGFWSKQRGADGGQGPDIDGWISNNPLRVVADANKMWYPNCAVPGEQTRQIYGAKLVNTVSSNTFWELDMAHHRTDYGMLQNHRNTAPLKGSKAKVPLYSSSQPGLVVDGNLGTEAEADAKAARGELGWENWRDWAKIRIGDYWYDETPWGYDPVSQRDITGEYRMASCNVRISDTYSRKWEAKGAVTSQLNRSNQVRGGFELARTTIFQYYDALDPSVNGGSRWSSEGKPWVWAFFGQDKLEYRGFIANLGLRLDGIVHGKYPVLNGAPGEPDSPYTEYLLAGNSDSLFQKVPMERVRQMRLSPRLGISHPISTVAKIFFNYGHMYQWPDAMASYRVRYDYRNSERVDRYGNPRVRPPRTIMYELGYEHNLFNRMSLRATAYYKDTNDNLDVNFYELLGAHTYEVLANRRFEDVRGFETFLELRRSAIPYLSGWMSMNWAIESGGNFGYERFYEDPTLEARPVGLQVSSPDVRPIFKANVDFQLPEDFGPQLGPLTLLGGLNANVLYTWQRGEQFTYNPAGLRGLDENIRWTPYQRFDLRFTKNLVSTGSLDALFYVDVTNVFNHRNMTRNVDNDVTNTQGLAWDNHKWWKSQFTNYMNSLDIEVGPDGKVTGKDRPGDFPKGALNATYVPINRVADLSKVTSGIRVGEFYLDRATGAYKIREGSNWRELTSEEQSRLDKAIDDKAYIDMPDFTPWTFLEMRDIFFGIKLYF